MTPDATTPDAATDATTTFDAATDGRPVVPVAPNPSALEPRAQTVVFMRPAKKKRRRWRGWVIALGILIVLGVVGYFVADGLARQYAVSYVKNEIRSVLHLAPTAPVDVNLGSESLIAQAIAGRVKRVDITVPEVNFGGIVGTATLTATDIPLDPSKPTGTIDVSVAVSQANVRQLASYLSGSDLKSIDVGNGVISIAADFPIFGLITVPVTVDLTPSASNGSIAFDPQSVTLGTSKISVADLRNNPQLAGLASQFLASREFCVAQYLPKALKLDAVHVVGSTVIVSVSGDRVALGGPEMQTMGVCSGTSK